jgi:hypothetical protein
MIVDNLYVFGAIRPPSETDSPLVVDSNTILSLSVASERFEPIAREGSQVIEARRTIEPTELLQRSILDLGRK